MIHLKFKNILFFKKNRALPVDRAYNVSGVRVRGRAERARKVFRIVLNDDDNNNNNNNNNIVY